MQYFGLIWIYQAN